MTFKVNDIITLKDTSKAQIVGITHGGTVVHYKRIDSLSGHITQYGSSIETALLQDWQLVKGQLT